MRSREVVIGVVVAVVVGLLVYAGIARAEEEPSEALVGMVADLLGDADRDMRALGLQQVREEVPGEAATRRFAALVVKLPAEGQAALVEALGDRGDRVALPAIAASLRSGDEAVRVAAVAAVGKLGGVAEVPLLLGKLTGNSAVEADAARGGLARLRGREVNAALVAAIAAGKPQRQAALLDVLARRNATETVEQVLRWARRGDPAVRAAALAALRSLADEAQTAELVEILKATGDGAERAKAEATLLAVCGRGREACAEAVVAGLQGAEPPVRIALLHALARIRGPKALRVLVRTVGDADKAVSDEALRVLSSWPNRAAVPHLVAIARTTDSLKYHVLSIRGLIRLGAVRGGIPADEKLLAEAMELARRPQEKQTVLATLGGLGTAAALAQIIGAMDDAALTEAAALAAVTCAEKGTSIGKPERRAAMGKVLSKAKGASTRERAEGVLDSL